MKLNFKKLIVAGAKALIRKYGDQVETAADKVIDKGANKAKAGVAKVIRRGK